MLKAQGGSLLPREEGVWSSSGLQEERKEWYHGGRGVGWWVSVREAKKDSVHNWTVELKVNFGRSLEQGEFGAL